MPSVSAITTAIPSARTTIIEVQDQNILTKNLRAVHIQPLRLRVLSSEPFYTLLQSPKPAFHQWKLLSHSSRPEFPQWKTFL
jgi:hypothetical protein